VNQYKVVFRLSPKGGHRTYTVYASDADQAALKAGQALERHLPWGMGWVVESVTDTLTGEVTTRFGS